MAQVGNRVTDHGLYVDEIELAEFVAELNGRIRARGIQLSTIRDMSAGARAHASARADSPLTPVFTDQVRGGEFGEGRWLVGRDEDGKVVALQALRALNISSSLADHLGRNAAYYAADEKDADHSRARSECRLTHRMSGRVVYHGEVWLHESMRGAGLAFVMPRMAMAIAVSAFGAEWVFGLSYPKTAHRGILSRYGYWRNIPGALVWRDQVGEVQYSNWICACEVEEDIHDIVGHYQEDWDDLFRREPSYGHDGIVVPLPAQG